MTKHINIDEILGKYEITHERLGIGDLRTTSQVVSAEIKSLLLEIIGEDEPVSVIYKRNPRILQQRVSNPTAIARNKLRQEQRQKLTNLFNLKENK